MEVAKSSNPTAANRGRGPAARLALASLLLAGMILVAACGNRIIIETSSTVSLTVENGTFNKQAIAVPPGETVTVVLTNNDDVTHALAVHRGFEDQTSVFEGEEVAPGETKEYQIDVPNIRARLWFTSSLHPAAAGKFVVTPRKDTMVDVSKKY
jgi:uncharacterized cupredoxin-like copper-binding protein